MVVYSTPAAGIGSPTPGRDELRCLRGLRLASRRHAALAALSARRSRAAARRSSVGLVGLRGAVAARHADVVGDLAHAADAIGEIFGAPLLLAIAHGP